MLGSMTPIMQRATELATKNTPGEVARSAGILLENLFLGFFAAVAWVLGRTWFYGSQLIYAAGLAFADGYKRGTKAQPKQPPAAVSAPLTAGPAQLLEDDRIADHMTPFGIPFGPNVQASHD